jgi:hypothetical protein
MAPYQTSVSITFSAAPRFSSSPQHQKTCHRKKNIRSSLTVCINSSFSLCTRKQAWEINSVMKMVSLAQVQLQGVVLKAREVSLDGAESDGRHVMD